MNTSVLLGDAVTQELPSFQDSVDASVSPFDNDKCGAKVYSLSLVDSNELLSAFLVLDGTTLSLATDDAALQGTYTVELMVSMENYPGVTALVESFQVEILACIPTLTASIVND